MPDTALPSLLSRIEAATGADEALDLAVQQAFEAAEYGSPFLSQSLDAVLALIERELPGWGVVLDTHKRHPLCVCQVYEPGKGPIAAYAATPALSILAALIRAKIAQTEEAHASGRKLQRTPPLRHRRDARIKGAEGMEKTRPGEPERGQGWGEGEER